MPNFLLVLMFAMLLSSAVIGKEETNLDDTSKNILETKANNVHGQPTTTPATVSTTPILTSSSSVTTTSSVLTTPTASTITPSTTVAPTPEPTPPSQGSWVYTDGKNVTCIVLQTALRVNISYANKDGNQVNTTFNLPASNVTKVVNGTCQDIVQFMTLSWITDGYISNNITFVFQKNDTTKKYFMSELIVSLNPNSSLIPETAANDTINLVHAHARVFETPLKKSYRCAKTQLIKLTSPTIKDNNITAVAEFSLLQEQAYHTDKGHTFGSYVDCEEEDLPDIVPIVVGCALGGLVLLVLIGYLISRRRGHARGYLSM